MKSAFTYLPIVKWKGGEQQAVQNLPLQDRAFARPMLEILPESVEDDDPTGMPPSDAYLKIVNQIVKSWGITEPAFVEMGLLDPATVAANNAHPLAHLFGLARRAGLKIIPVTGVYRDPGYQGAVAASAATDGRGVCIRITPEDIAEQTFPTDLQSLLTTLRVSIADTDIVLDSGYIQTNQLASTTAMAVGFVATLPQLAAWRSVTFAASAFPQLLSSVGVGTGLLPRTEWDVWRRVSARSSALRQVIFGDYTAAHPIYTSLPFPGSANIRYTIDDAWLILRGQKVTSPVYGGYQQYVALSRQLIADSRYCGPGFSWGDQRIHDCAQGTATTGNMSTWRAVATNHHIRYVLRQIASLPASLTGPAQSSANPPT